MKTNLLAFAAFACAVSVAYAQTPQVPAIHTFVPADSNGQVFHMSDNGKWAVGQAFSDAAVYSSPFLMNLEDGSVTNLYTDTQKDLEGEARDVTDDGKLIAGSWCGNPAVYNTETKIWQDLPVPTGFKYQSGVVSTITPDGKYAVGYFYIGSAGSGGAVSYIERSMMWDLSGQEPVCVTLSDVPEFDTAGNNADSVRFIDLTTDGQNILVYVNFTALMTAWTYMYNVPSQTYTPLGTVVENGKVYPGSGEIIAVDEGKFSKDGRLIGLSAINQDDESVIAIYDIAAKTFTVVPESTGKFFGDIDNNGVIYASTPNNMLLRNWGFYAQGYWFDWKQVLDQQWGIDWQNDIVKDDLGMSGTVSCVSADGLEVMSVAYDSKPTKVFKINLVGSLDELGKTLDPLANHIITPAEGSVFSNVRTISIEFDRDIEVLGSRNAAYILDPDGNQVYQSMAFTQQAGESRILSITFRNAVLAKDKTYTVVIPAGTIGIKGDSGRTNSEIRINYVGRDNVAVAPLQISPEPGTGMPRLSMGTNPVTITFDAMLSPLEDGGVELYSMQDNNWELLTTLSGDIQGNKLTVYPLSEIRLAKDNRYKIVVKANTVGDLAGNNGNEMFEFEYVGTFERDVRPDNGMIFKIDFNSGFEEMMLYDGDHNTPQSTMANWGFTYEYPWWMARDDESSSDQAAVSHSLYSPAGTSDDWMITPQLYIPDADTRLTFQSQSYKKNAEDHLKVYVYATENVFTAISNSVIERFKANAELIYDEIQSPGASEELLAGDWKDNEISLAKYAGKDIYIAFVNDNNNQSAVFVDNITVERDLQFSVSFNVEEYVVDATETPVAGRIEVLTADSFKGVELKLYDAEDNLVDEISNPDATMTKGDVYDFSFEKQLPLIKSARNRYRVEAKVGDVATSFTGSIINLNFKPRRTVVIEEVTGSKCQFCPLGHRALEVLGDLYGDQLIPIAVHSYSGGSDFLTNWTSAYGAFLGMSAAPTGAVNRKEAGSPFASDGIYYYYNDPVNENTWFDMVSRQVAQLTEAEVDIDKAVINPTDKTISIEASMRYAYDNDNVNLNLFTVVLENGLRGRQSNGIYNNTSETLGPWGHGGKYGQSTVNYTFDHVARGMHGTNFTGVSGFFPRSITAGESYPASYTFEIPAYLENNANAEVAVMLIDANTGYIVNAARKLLTVEGSGVDSIATDSNAPGDVYSITGVKVLRNAVPSDFSTLAPGIYIYNGRKIQVK